MEDLGDGNDGSSKEVLMETQSEGRLARSRESGAGQEREVTDGEDDEIRRGRWGKIGKRKRMRISATWVRIQTYRMHSKA